MNYRTRFSRPTLRRSLPVQALSREGEEAGDLRTTIEPRLRRDLGVVVEEA